MLKYSQFQEAVDPFVKHKDKLINDKYLRFGDAFNKAQIKKILSIREFDTFINSAVRGEILVRRDKSFDNVYYIANAYDQKYVFKVAITSRGKIFDWTVYKKEGNVMSIIKSWSVDD